MQQTNKPYEGLFITIEGGEGSGKTTIAEHIATSLDKRGFDVLRTREPGGAPLSEHLRQVILNPKGEFKIGERAELLLFLAARIQHVEEVILPALRKGKVVICERFNDSTIAYQGSARHLGMHYVENLCDLVCEGFITPNVTLFFDLDPAEGMKRVRAQRGEAVDRLEQEALQFHKEVRQGYLHLADQHPERIHIIDASAPLEEVIATTLQTLEPCLLIKPSRS